MISGGFSYICVYSTLMAEFSRYSLLFLVIKSSAKPWRKWVHDENESMIITMIWKRKMVKTNQCQALICRELLLDQHTLWFSALLSRQLYHLKHFYWQYLNVTFTIPYQGFCWALFLVVFNFSFHPWKEKKDKRRREKFKKSKRACAMSFNFPWGIFCKQVSPEWMANVQLSYLPTARLCEQLSSQEY